MREDDSEGEKNERGGKVDLFRFGYKNSLCQKTNLISKATFIITTYIIFGLISLILIMRIIKDAFFL